MSTTEGWKATEGDADTRALLVELAVTAHKHGMYPRDHPQLRAAAEGLSNRLGPLLAERGSFAIGVGMDGLIVDESLPQTGPPIVRDFARRLRDHQVGSLILFEGIDWSEFERFFAALEADAASEPASDAGSFGPNLQVRSAGFERLHLDEIDAPDPDLSDPEALWADLAQAALSDSFDLEDAVDAIALAINRSSRDASASRRIAACLTRIVENLGARGSDGRQHPVSLRVSDLLLRLRSETLKDLLEFDGDVRARASLIRSAGPVLMANVLTMLLSAAAEASERDVSRSVLRLFRKISRQQDARDVDTARLAKAEIQEGLRSLVADWQLTDPNPPGYNALLDAAAFAAAMPKGAIDHPQIGADERLLRICLDLDHWAEAADRAVDRLLDAAQAGLLLDLIGGATPGRAARSLANRALTPRLLAVLTSGEQVDRDQLDRVVRTMGRAAIEPLLDALSESHSRSMRRITFDTLVGLGPDVSLAALERVHDERWFVRRNILALIGRIGVAPDLLPLMRFVEDPDSRVRIQALSVAAGHPDAEPAFTSGLDDPEQKVVLAALRNLPETVPPRLWSQLARIAQSDTAGQTRLLAVRALGRIQDVRVRSALVALASPGRNWFGRVRIRHDAVAVEAVRSLARQWKGAREIRPLMRAAAKVKDPQIRAAAGAAA